MALSDLSEAELAAIATRVKERITEASVGMKAPADATAMEIASAAVIFVVQVAPKAPEAIGREAAVRLAGWLLDNRPAVVSHEMTDPERHGLQAAIRQHGGDRERRSTLGRPGAAIALHRAPRRDHRLMRWPWSKPEAREAIGGYTGIISALIGAQAAGTTQQASATAAVEAAAGALSRAFMAATVEGPADIAEAVSPRTLAQIGRDLVRVGESLHVIRYMGGAASPGAIIHLVLGRRRGPGDLAMHGDGLRAVRLLNLAPADGLGCLRRLGKPRPRGRTMGCHPLAGLPTPRGSWRTLSDPWRTRPADRWRNCFLYRKTAATAIATPTR